MRRSRRACAAVVVAAALTVAGGAAPAAAGTSTVRGACSAGGHQVASVAVTYHLTGRKWDRPVAIDRISVTTRAADTRSAVRVVTRQTGSLLASRQATGAATFAGFPSGSTRYGVTVRVALSNRTGRSLCAVALAVGPYQPR